MEFYFKVKQAMDLHGFFDKGNMFPEKSNFSNKLQL
jgi:hypothetical protein